MIFLLPFFIVVISSRFENKTMRNHLKEKIFFSMLTEVGYSFDVCLSDYSVSVLNVQEQKICHGNRAAPLLKVVSDLTWYTPNV